MPDIQYDPVEAIRIECRVLREGGLLHPPNHAAATAIEAHLNQILDRTGVMPRVALKAAIAEWEWRSKA